MGFDLWPLIKKYDGAGVFGWLFNFMVQMTNLHHFSRDIRVLASINEWLLYRRLEELREDKETTRSVDSIRSYDKKAQMDREPRWRRR